MSRPPELQKYWEPSVKELFANEPRLKNSEVLDKLGKDLAARPDSYPDAPPLPSERTIARIRKSLQDDPPEVRQAYRYVSWPESFGTPDLPWSASASLLELMSVYPAGERLTVRVAKWYWRVTQAVPEASAGWRLEKAVFLVHGELGRIPDIGREIRRVERELLNFRKLRFIPEKRTEDKFSDPDKSADEGWRTYTLRLDPEAAYDSEEGKDDGR